MKLTTDLIEKAYKKLKSSVYYDKTQLALRNDIVEFEQKYPGRKLDKYLQEEIYNALLNPKKLRMLMDKICNSINVVMLPKKLAKKTSTNEEDTIIINSMSREVVVEELQYYIDMNVEGHILGVLWILLMGYKLDAAIYEHSYGNRIRKNLFNEFSDKITYSPYIFQPYFEQYESWRDRAMSEAQKHMSEKQDVIVLTLDFRRYYYSLDIDDKVLSKVFEEATLEEADSKDVEIFRLLNNFIGEVINTYSHKIGSEFNHRRVLPIGFLPSNILGNWCLKKFDRAIVDGLNPVYYGRYVDDILIVDKVERNSTLYNAAKNNELTRETVIKYFLTCRSKHEELGSTGKENNLDGIIIENGVDYCVNPK